MPWRRQKFPAPAIWRARHLGLEYLIICSDGELLNVARTDSGFIP